MMSLKSSLEGRRDEFDAHLNLAQALESRMLFDASLGDVSLSVRHINNIKSGLIVHLYNIVEAIMTQAMSSLGSALGSVDPRRWTEWSLKEWLRESVVSRTSEGNEDGRLATALASSRLLLSQGTMGPQKLKKPSGSWDDKVIAKFCERMNVTFQMSPEMWRRIRAAPEYADKTPLQFLANRRNAIAHGRRSFEDGASDLDLNQIGRLAAVTLDYLSFAADAFQNHLTNEAHLLPL